MHPSNDPAVQARRQAEFDAARSAYEVEELTKRWQVEDRALAEAAGHRGRELADLRQRVARLERRPPPDPERMLDCMADVIGDVLPRLIELELRKRGVTVYRGVWSPEARYPHGSLVTCKGSAWSALSDVPAGVRPGSDPAWQLAVKAERPPAREPGTA